MWTNNFAVHFLEHRFCLLAFNTETLGDFQIFDTFFRILFSNFFLKGIESKCNFMTT